MWVIWWCWWYRCGSRTSSGKGVARLSHEDCLEEGLYSIGSCRWHLVDATNSSRIVASRLVLPVFYLILLRYFFKIFSWNYALSSLAPCLSSCFMHIELHILFCVVGSIPKPNTWISLSWLAHLCPKIEEHWKVFISKWLSFVFIHIL